ncbi:hypothetical protein KFE98_17295 [bacterium SCSIO 12741]|nr:hypothetical protein KFE98_17295 [bacterium SCSIO 12741]
MEQSNTESTATTYRLRCTNASAISWYFYLYYRMVDQSEGNYYSLVWKASPFEIAPQSFYNFSFTETESFHWLYSENLDAGTLPMAGGGIPAQVPTNNRALFNIEENVPQLSNASPEEGSTDLAIYTGDKVPNAHFSTGIGMSGSAALVQPAYANTMQTFPSNLDLWLAASQSKVWESEVLNLGEISNSIAVQYPLNVSSLMATINESNEWVLNS